jgi:uncharacterized DUF497 family protein
MRIEFDADKDAANLKKHGVSPAFAVQVLADAHRLDLLDVRFNDPEDRFVTYGSVVNLGLRVHHGDIHRIISVRKANDRETRRYKESPR